MTPLFAALLVIVFFVGLTLIALGVSGKNSVTGPSKIKSRSKSLGEKLKEALGARRLIFLAAGIILGIIVFSLTGWPVAFIALVLGGIFLPRIFTASEAIKQVDKLDALETWSRQLSGLISTGANSLVQAIIRSAPNAPDEIKPEVQALVAKLQSRWIPKRAFKAFADDLNDPSADLLAAHLILASRINVAGLPDALDDLSALLFDEVRQRREIDAARESNRTTSRMVTIITLAMLIFGSVLAKDFFTFYSTPVGQLVLAAILGLYALCLIWMAKLSKPELPPRILTEGEQ